MLHMFLYGIEAGRCRKEKGEGEKRENEKRGGDRVGGRERKLVSDKETLKANQIGNRIEEE